MVLWLHWVISSAIPAEFHLFLCSCGLSESRNYDLECIPSEQCGMLEAENNTQVKIAKLNPQSEVTLATGISSHQRCESSHYTATHIPLRAPCHVPAFHT